MIYIISQNKYEKLSNVNITIVTVCSCLKCDLDLWREQSGACLTSKTNRRYDSALWRAGGNRAGRREYRLVTNCLRTADKKVDNQENQSWVNVEFQKSDFHEVCLYGIEGSR